MSGQKDEVHSCFMPTNVILGYVSGLSAASLIISGICSNPYNRARLAFGALVIDFCLAYIASLSSKDTNYVLTTAKQVLLKDMNINKDVLRPIEEYIVLSRENIIFILMALVEPIILKKFTRLRESSLYQIHSLLYIYNLKVSFSVLLLSSLVGHISCIAHSSNPKRMRFAIYSSARSAWKFFAALFLAAPFNLMHQAVSSLLESFGLFSRKIRIIQEQPSHANLSIKINTHHCPRNVVFISLCLGLLGGIGIGLGMSSGSIIPLGLFAFFVSLFHILEYICLSLYNEVQISAFLLNNSYEYPLAIISAISEYLIKARFFRINISPAYLACCAVGVIFFQIIRSTAILTAKNKFSHRIYVSETKDGKIVDTGIYSIIRHPSYVGFFGFTFMNILLMKSFINLIIQTGILIIFFSKRTIEEEEILVKKYPAYKEYSERVGRFIPNYLEKKLTRWIP